VSIVWADSDITVATLIEAIHVLTIYRGIGTFVVRLERRLRKSTEIVTCRLLGYSPVVYQ
jgi:hypothetical protein